MRRARCVELAPGVDFEAVSPGPESRESVALLVLEPDGKGRTIVLGSNVLAGQHLQVVVPRGIWQGSRLMPGGTWALLGCTVSPGFEFEDHETGVRTDLCAGWPAFDELITKLTRIDAALLQ